MRKFAAILLLLAVLFTVIPVCQNVEKVIAASPTTWLTGWTYGKSITIDHTKIDATLTDFPVLVKLTSSNFAFSHSNSDGYDIRFADTNGNLLRHERLLHDSTNSVAWYYVRVPSVSSSVDTNFFLYYRTTDTPDGSDTVDVWDSGFASVYHMTGSSTTLSDSTINARTATKKGTTEPTEATGEVYKGQTYDGSNDYAKTSATDIFGSSSDVTVSIWVNPNSTQLAYATLIDHDMNGGGVGARGNFRIEQNNTSNRVFYFVYSYDGTNFQVCKDATALTASTWTYLTARKNGTSFDWFINGSKDGSTQTGLQTGLQNRSEELEIGAWAYDNSRSFGGTLDEVRVSISARSDAWIKAEYYSDSDGLLTYGTETSADALPSWNKSGWSYRQRIEIQGSGSIVGTVTVTNASTTITGVGTTFTDWLVGDGFKSTDGTWYTISAIASNTSLTLTGNYGGSTLAGQLYEMRHADYPVRLDLMSNKSVLAVNHNMNMLGATEANSVVLDVGSAGAWDDYGVGCVQVVPKGDGTYYMPYNGWDSIPVNGEPMYIGLATSPNLTNGGTWTKTTSGIGGTSKVLGAPIGWENIYGCDVYKVGSTWYLIGGPIQATSLVFTNKDYTQNWLYSTTDFINYTELGWWYDIYDQDWATNHLVMNPNPSLLKDNDAVPVQVGGYYYMVTSALTDDVTTEYGIRLMRSTTLDNRVQTISGTADTDSDMIQDDDYFAFTFTTPSTGYDIAALRLGLLKSGTPTANVTYEIYAVDANHKPTGSKLCSGYFDDSAALSTSAQTISLRLQTEDSDRTLVANTEYCCVAKFASGTGTDHVHVRYDADGASGYVWKTTDGGTNWTQISGASVPCVIHKHIWDDLGWIQDPSDYNTTNTYIDKYVFDNKLIKWGDQYVVVHGGGNSADTYSQQRAYFSYTNNISDLNSWVMCKEPWNTSSYKFEGRSAFYDDGTRLHVWLDHRTGSSSNTTRVLYYYNDINKIVSLGGHSQTSFGDLRWMDDDGSDDLKHWTEDSLQDSVNGWASQWVKVPYIPASGRATFVWIYYGNAGASSVEDGANVFTLYDHFTAWDEDKWGKGGTVTQSGTQLALEHNDTGSYVQSDTTYNVGYAFRNRWKRVDTSVGLYIPEIYVDANNYRIIIQQNPTGNGLFQTIEKKGGVGPVATDETIHTRTDNVWHVTEITRDGNGCSKFWIDYFLERTISTSMTGAVTHLFQNTDTVNATSTLDVDWAIVRKCCSTEPMVWAGSATEEAVMPTHGFIIFQDPGIM